MFHILSIRKIDTALRFHLSLIRMTSSYGIKNLNDNKLVRIWGKTMPYALLIEMQIWISTMEHNVKILHKVKLELPYDPAV